MEILDNPQLKPIEELVACRILDKIGACGIPMLCATLHHCGPVFLCGPRLYESVTEGLVACGAGFKCPGFLDKVGPTCPAYDPVIVFKQHELEERLTKLVETKIRELELRLKK